MAIPPASYSSSSAYQRTPLTTRTHEMEQGAACVPTESSLFFQHGLTTSADQSQYLSQSYDDDEDPYSSIFEADISQTSPTHSIRSAEIRPKKSSALVELGTISIPSSHAVWDCVEKVKKAIGERNHDDLEIWFSALVMELNEIEEKYENEHQDINDIEFDESIIKAFHQAFSNIMEFELDEIVRKLKCEADNKENYRSYETLFLSFERKIINLIKKLPDRWRACLNEFTENLPGQILLCQDDVDKVCRFLKEHQGSYEVSDDAEFRKALDRVAKFDNQKKYTSNQLSVLYKCAERIIRTLDSQTSLSLPEKYTAEDVCKLVETIPDIIANYTESLKKYSKVQDSSHLVGKKFLEAFLEMRGKPKFERDGSGCARPVLLQKYLARSTKTASELRAALKELKTTGYWTAHCPARLKSRIDSALDYPVEFQRFKEHLDSICQHELEDSPKKLATEDMNTLIFVQGLLGERMISSQVMRRAVTLLSNIPTKCFAMINHLFGTSSDLRIQNPSKHSDVREGNAFKLALCLEETGQLSSVSMKFDEKSGRVNLILRPDNGNDSILDIWIITPDGRPYLPSPLNGLALILGPGATIPLAIEGNQTKAVSYDYCTGRHRTSYESAEDMRLQYTKAVNYTTRKALTDQAVFQSLIKASDPDKMMSKFMELGGALMLEPPSSKQADQSKLSRVSSKHNRLEPSGQDVRSHSYPTKEKPRQPSMSQHAHAQYVATPSKKTGARPKSTQAKPVVPLEQTTGKSATPTKAENLPGEGRRSTVLNLFSKAKSVLGKRN